MEKCILFDFDGVIVDSYKASFTVAKLMHPILTEKMHRSLFDGNTFDMHEHAIPHTEECRHDLDYYAAYTPQMKAHSRLIPGMDEVIRTLAKTYTLFIISSVRSGLINDFLREVGCEGLVTWTMGDDVHRKKDEKIRMVFERYGFDSASSVFVTDTLGDIREARSVDVGSIGVSWGFQESENLEKGSPFRIVNTPEELPSAVEAYFASV